MIAETIPSEQRVLLRSITWETYQTLVENPDRAGYLMTYDQGNLEIMSPSWNHELDKSLIGRMIEMFSLHENIDLATSASTTFKRSDLKSGFEADESYYIRNESVVRGKQEIDLLVDPPPDLVVEIEHSRSAINKLALLAQIGVPEVWRYDGQNLWIGQLGTNAYTQSGASEQLPGFPVDAVVQTLQAVGTASETELIRRFMNRLTSPT